MYNPASVHADEFINHEEILETLEEARVQSRNHARVEEILAKAALCKGLTHREAAILLDCDDPALEEKIYTLAREIKHKFYGNRIVLFAPLYLSNYCINGCVYCPYHAKNRSIPRKKLSQPEIEAEVRALIRTGHKRLALEAGEDPVHNPLEYILDSIKTVYSVNEGGNSIRRVNVNIAATDVESYRRLKAAGIGTYILFQETYNKEQYKQLHPTGPKSDYDWHTEAMDRAQEGGCDDVGVGVLFGLSGYRYELVGLLMHAEHLEARFGVGPHTISMPRICPADDISLESFPDALPDAIFRKIVAVLRVAVPYTGMIISTRESARMRSQLLDCGISQISGGSRTSVGGYTTVERHDETSQFDVSDTRTLDEVVRWLLEQDHIPSFCTACYREGRTGDRFMSLCKSGKIHLCCTPNALMTLKEYLMDYASPETRAVGEALIARSLGDIPLERTRAITEDRLQRIQNGERDFRF
ncbi:MAG: [FeFe] hydrogenase H-cluster radical SAM maturase HydG [Bacteroidales bacterium]|nr:[FeFe] hydrogenase H-cluster radical SAM maturase HydG [Bacteroidales bacterium]